MKLHHLAAAAALVLSTGAAFAATPGEQVLTRQESIDPSTAIGFGRAASYACPVKQRLLVPERDALPLPETPLKGMALSPLLTVDELLGALMDAAKTPVKVVTTGAVSQARIGDSIAGYIAEGTLADVVEHLSKSLGFYYKLTAGNVLTVTYEREFEVKLPQVGDYLKSAKETLTGFGARGVVVEPTSARAVFSANRRNAERIERHLSNLNRDFAQVGVELYIMSRKVNDSDSRGINWNELSKKFSSGGIGFSMAGGGTPGSGQSNFQFQLGNVSIDGVLEMLKSEADATVTQSPRHVVRAGVETSFNVVQDNSYLVAEATAGQGGTITKTVRKEVVNTGLTIKLKPSIDNGMVWSDINIEQNELLGRQVQTIDGNRYEMPRSEQTKAKSEMRIRSGDAWLLTGLRSTRVTDSGAGVNLPWVGDLGGLLRSNKTVTKDSSELLILIRPTILESQDCK